MAEFWNPTGGATAQLLASSRAQFAAANDCRTTDYRLAASCRRVLSAGRVDVNESRR